MAYSKVRWISTQAFLVCIGGAHGRGEGTNVREGARTAEVGARMAEGAPQPTVCTPPAAVCTPQSSVCAPYAGVCTLPTGVCAPQPAVCAPNNPDYLTWQRCGSHRRQSKSKFTLSKVNKTLILIGRIRTLSDVTDGRMHRQPWLI
jgi:hypothetical protein